MHEQPQAHGDRLVSIRSMDIIVALLFLGASAVVIIDSLRIGVAWKVNEGPAAGYFPFRIAVLMALASLVTLIKALMGRTGRAETFVTRAGFKKVLVILIPLAIYVACIGGIETPAVQISALTIPEIRTPALGIYLSSLLYILGFMTILGRYRIDKAIVTSLLAVAVLFWLFELKFLVPLPKASPPLDVVDERGLRWLVTAIDGWVSGWVVAPLIGALDWVLGRIGLKL